MKCSLQRCFCQQNMGHGGGGHEREGGSLSRGPECPAAITAERGRWDMKNAGFSPRACAGQLTKVTAVDVSQRVGGARRCQSRHLFAFVTFLIEKFGFSISFFLCKRGGGLYHFEDASLTCLLSEGPEPSSGPLPAARGRHSPGACRGSAWLGSGDREVRLARPAGDPPVLGLPLSRQGISECEQASELWVVREVSALHSCSCGRPPFGGEASAAARTRQSPSSLPRSGGTPCRGSLWSPLPFPVLVLDV